MNILGIIPARYASTRLPGKPLADIGGKPMIQHVYERARLALDQVVIATDDERIVEAAKSFNANVVFTSDQHPTGTNRCLEAYRIYQEETQSSFDVVLNIQGDEPLLEPGLLSILSGCFENPDVEMATLAVKVTDSRELFDENRVFVIMDIHGDALYFSRSPLPHVRGVDKQLWLDHHPYYKHLGLYAYTPAALEKFALMPLSALEKAESLEQNRWLEAGKKIRVKVTPHESIAVDTEADLERVRQMIKTDSAK